MKLHNIYRTMGTNVFTRHKYWTGFGVFVIGAAVVAGMGKGRQQILEFFSTFFSF